MENEKTRYTFNDETRYITRGINNEVPSVIQRLLWDMIDSKIQEGFELDYLQVFHVEIKDGALIIKHSQEVPSYERTITLTKKSLLGQSLSFHIFVIDDIDHSTMLLSSEY